MKILKILVLVLLILLPLGELVRFNLGNDFAIKPLDVVTGAMFVVWLIICKKRITPYIKLVIIFPIIGLLSLVINSTWLKPNEFFISLLYLVRWISYASLPIIVSGFDEKFRKIIHLFFTTEGLFILIAGYIQFFLYPDLHALSYLGWDIHMYRMVSTFLDPNFAGAFLVLYALFIAGSLWSLIKKTRYKESIFYIAILIFTIIAVFLTYSRSALLMLIAGFVVFLILIKKKKFILIMLGSILLFITIVSPFFYIENINLLRGASSMARIANYETALKLIKDRPLLGVGFNSYRYAKNLYRISSGWTKAPSHADAGIENSFLFILATTGIFGLLAYLWLWLNILKRSFYLYRQKSGIMDIIVISSIMGIFVDSLFINSLFYSSIMLWLWVIVGFIKWDSFE